METANNKSSFDDADSRTLRSSSIDYNANAINSNPGLSRLDSTTDREISRHRNGTIQTEIPENDIINFGQTTQTGAAPSNFISPAANQQIYISQFPGAIPSATPPLPFFFSAANAHIGVSAPANQQFPTGMAIPSTHPATVPTIPDVDARQPEDRALPIGQVEMLDEGVMNIQQEIPDHTILVPLNDQPPAYNYINETTYPAVSTTLENPSSTGMRFKKNNCTVWEYTLLDKKTASIRLALQDGQVFFDLEDILEGVCGIEMTMNKLISVTKSLTPWDEKVSAVQFGDTAFEKEEIFVTLDGLTKLKNSRVSSFHKTRRQYAQSLSSFIQTLTKMMIQSFGRECLLLEQSSSRTLLPDDSSNIDAVIRAWRYYRMLTDRLEAQFAKERLSTSQMYQAPTQELESASKRPRLDSTELPHALQMQDALLQAHPTLLNDAHPPPAVMNQHEVQAEQENQGLTLMMENQPGPMIGFPIRTQRNEQATNFSNAVYESIINGGNPDTFIDPNPIMIEEQPLHEELTTERNHEDPVTWTSELISNVQSSIKKGKRCPVCSNRCGNSSKICSVCRTPFRHAEKTEEKRFKCSYEGCNMRFRFESQLIAHLRSHQNMKVFTCNICNKLFATSSSLKCHLRIHNNEKPYPCTAEGCTKSFRTHTQLKQHMLQHTGELPFKCTFPGCDACFRTKRMLEPHLRSHNNEPSPHKCNVEGCGKVFAYRSGLLSHIKTVHDQKLPFHCHEKDCNMHFTSNAQLQEHYERVHRNQHAHTLLYDSSRLQSQMQSIPLPVLPLDINGSGQGQQMISSV